MEQRKGKLLRKKSKTSWVQQLVQDRVNSIFMWQLEIEKFIEWKILKKERNAKRRRRNSQRKLNVTKKRQRKGQRRTPRSENERKKKIKKSIRVGKPLNVIQPMRK